MRVLAEFLRDREARQIDLPTGASGLDLVRALDIAPDAHLLARGETPIPIDEPLRDGETILVIRVVSGG